MDSFSFFRRFAAAICQKAAVSTFHSGLYGKFYIVKGPFSSHFDNNRLKLSAHAYFMLLSHLIWSKHNSCKANFYDVIINELYSSCFQLNILGPRAIYSFSIHCVFTVHNQP